MSFMLCFNYAECRKKAHLSERRYAECRYAECRYAECRGAILSTAGWG
jgi:hypothetical protein